MEDLEDSFKELSLAMKESSLTSVGDAYKIVFLINKVLNSPIIIMSESQRKSVEEFKELVIAYAENDISSILTSSLSVIGKGRQGMGTDKSEYTTETTGLYFLPAVFNIGWVDINRKIESWKSAILPLFHYTPEKVSVLFTFDGNKTTVQIKITD